MRQMWMCLVAMAVGGAISASLYVSQGWLKLRSAPSNLQAPARSSQQEVTNVEPLVMMPNHPPKFIFEMFEPIVIQPESSEPNFPGRNETVPFQPEPPRPMATVRNRMPLANEIARVAWSKGNAESREETSPILHKLFDLAEDILVGTREGEDVLEFPEKTKVIQGLTPAGEEETFTQKTADTFPEAVPPLQMPLCPSQAEGEQNEERENGSEPGDPENNYSSDPIERMDQLSNQSEILREIRKEWERYWFMDQPSHMTPIRVHGGVGP